MKKITLEQLESAYDKLKSGDTSEHQICAELIRQEIKRRKGAGRKPSKLTRKEQNRKNQKVWRERQKELKDKQN